MNKAEYDAYIAEGRVFKDKVFSAVVEFKEHEQECLSCSNEAGLSVFERGLCDEGRRILAWWFNEPEFVISSVACVKCGHEA